MIKNLLLLFSFIVLFILGGYVTHRYYHSFEKTQSVSGTVLLEQVKTVAKLVAVEGYFSEIYDYKDYYRYDFSPLRKRALLRVKAKVSVGYDMENFNIRMDSAARILTITELPDPEILSVDHDLDYYDMQEGLFNSFSSADYNKLQTDAKDMIYETARQRSDLFIQAENQSAQMLETIEWMVKAAGWKLEYEKRNNTVLEN